jgi:ribosomal protein S18 acetylase RimI-like enzyme
MQSVIDPNPSPQMKAMEENLHGHVAFLQRRLPGMRVDEPEGLMVVDSGLPDDTFNKIVASRLLGADVDRRIDKALAHFRRADRPFSWWVGPCSRPLDLEGRLERRGLRPAEREVGMILDLEDMPEALVVATDASIRRVSTPGELRDFGGLLAGLSDPPNRNVIELFERASDVLHEEDCPMRLFVAYIDGRPAAVSELFLGGGLAGIHMVATASAFRRRGLGMSVTWAALDEGRRCGMTVGSLQAVEQAQRVYERLGFRPCGRFVEYSPA